MIENGNGANNVPAYRALRTNRFLYAEHRTTGEYELYDLKRDPYQLRSVDGQAGYAAIERDMAQRLRAAEELRGATAARSGRRSSSRCAHRAGPSSREAARAATCRARIGGRDRGRVVGAVFKVARRRVASVAAEGPISQRIRKPSVPEGGATWLRVRAELRDGRLFTLDRRLRACSVRPGATRAALALLLGVRRCLGVRRPRDPGQGGSRPNIVVIMTDDQTLESMRVMPGVRSVLGRRGTTFERAFVSTALCCPSRATLFTGQYMHNHGVLGNRPPEGGYGRLDTTEWLPVWLQRAGYHTLHIGKFLNRYGQDSPPDRGAAGLERVVRVGRPLDLPVLRLHGSTRTAWSRRYPRYSTDEYTQRSGGRRDARLAPARDALLPLGRLPRAAQRRPARPRRPAGSARPRARPRATATRFAGEPLPRSPAFNEADVSDKPNFIRRAAAAHAGARGRASRRTTARSSSRCSPSTRAS